MGPIGAQEMMAIVVLALLLFGPKKLPELARLLGKGLTEFRRAKNELKATFDTHMGELEREVRASEYQSKQVSAPAPSYSPASYPYPYEDNAPYEAPVTHELNASNDTLAIESAPEQIPAVASVPVPEGTVPRVNGVRPIDSPVHTAPEPLVHIATEEERSA
ncbi:MAG: twin-arginine translocase TatA/TatE family subunit [Acidobacteriota bacterium]|nr:twin-arginine translocase TatA/TatE family subunit [Acidobacteriota bacterium]